MLRERWESQWKRSVDALSYEVQKCVYFYGCYCYQIFQSTNYWRKFVVLLPLFSLSPLEYPPIRRPGHGMSTASMIIDCASLFLFLLNRYYHTWTYRLLRTLAIQHNLSNKQQQCLKLRKLAETTPPAIRSVIPQFSLELRRLLVVNLRPNLSSSRSGAVLRRP